MTYPRYHREMIATRARLLAGGTILETDHGDIEYAIEGQGAPVSFVAARRGRRLRPGLSGCQDGFRRRTYKVISVSRLWVPAYADPANASLNNSKPRYIETSWIICAFRRSLCWATRPEVLRRRNLPTTIRKGPRHSYSYGRERSIGPGDKPAFYVGIIHLIQRSDYAYWLVARFCSR